MPSLTSAVAAGRVAALQKHVDQLSSVDCSSNSMARNPMKRTLYCEEELLKMDIDEQVRLCGHSWRRVVTRSPQMLKTPSELAEMEKFGAILKELEGVRKQLKLDTLDATVVDNVVSVSVLSLPVPQHCTGT